MEYREAAQMSNSGVCEHEVTVAPKLFSLSLSATSNRWSSLLVHQDAQVWQPAPIMQPIMLLPMQLIPNGVHSDVKHA